MVVTPDFNSRRVAAYVTAGGVRDGTASHLPMHADPAGVAVAAVDVTH